MTQRFEHARIKPEGQPEFEVLFNPNRYSLEKSNQIAEVGIPGLGSPILQFVRGNARTLSMELFFDTYEQQQDVREHTNRIYALLGIEPESHVPPICSFTWGQFTFRCILERVAGAYTLFLADGTPVRAVLNVTFKEYLDVEVQVRNPPTQSVDYHKRCQVQLGDTLAGIAAREYGDPENWRPIALANGIANPRRLEPGRILVIPSLI